MPLYTVNHSDMIKLIERDVANTPSSWLGGEITFIDTFQFTRKEHGAPWIGPYHQRHLLEEILIENNLEIELIDAPDEVKEEASLDHLNVDALEEEQRTLYNIELRLNKFED